MTMTSKLVDYTQLLQRIVNAFDFDERGWPTTIVVDGNGLVGRAMVGEELADILQETKELLEDYGDEG